jgi:hypothetical protein
MLGGHHGCATLLRPATTAKGARAFVDKDDVYIRRQMGEIARRAEAQLRSGECLGGLVAVPVELACAALRAAAASGLAQHSTAYGRIVARLCCARRAAT